MSKKEKQVYLKVGQAVCNLAGGLLFFAVPILGCVAVGVLNNLILDM